MHRILLLLIIIIGSYLTSCSDSTEPTQENSTKFLPLKTGNYWIFNSYEKDFNNGIIYSTQSLDSVVIENMTTIDGVPAYFFVRYRNGEVYDTMFYSYDDGFVNRLFDSISIPIPGLKSTWFPIANFKTLMNGTWNIYKKLIINYIFIDENSEYISNYWHTINGEFIYVDYLDFEGGKYLTKSFINKYDSKLEYRRMIRLSETSYDTVLVTRLLKYYDKYQFVEGIGLFKMQRDSYTINTTTSPSSTFGNVEYVKGFESLLKKFHVKY